MDYFRKIFLLVKLKNNILYRENQRGCPWLDKNKYTRTSNTYPDALPLKLSR